MRDEDTRIIDADPTFLRDHGMCGYREENNPAFRKKLEWSERRFKEGMRIKILYSERAGNIGSIEYLPGEYAWRGVRATGYMVIHCLFITKKEYKGRGYGSRLIEACENDARERRMHGVAVVASKSTWMAKKEVFLKREYVMVDETPPHYQLLVRRFRKEAPLPGFSGRIEDGLARYADGLTILHSDQCPYVIKTMNEIPRVAREEFGVEPTIVALPDCRAARDSPNPYGIFSIIWNGKLVADHPISATRFRNIMKKALK